MVDVSLSYLLGLGLPVVTAQQGEVDDVKDVEAMVARQAEIIREMKAQRQEKTAIAVAVGELLRLKSLLPVGHSLRPEEVARRNEEAAQDAKTLVVAERLERLKSLEHRASKIQFPLCQRKIHHIFRHEGSGHSFHYVPEEVHPDCKDWVGSPIIVTEKWDGTTVQATSEGIFKRADNFKRGSQAKRGVSASDRYRLELLDLDAEENVHIRQAVAPHLAALAALEEGLCVYFEALGPGMGGGPGISARNAYALLVFDFSVDGRFMLWPDVERLARQYDLPLVHSWRLESFDPAMLYRQLTDYARYAVFPPTFSEEPFEGFVLRHLADADRIAKARKDTQ